MYFLANICEIFKKVKFWIMKKIKKFTVDGENSEITAVSLVEAPAIMEDFIFLSKQGETMQVMLDSNEKHMVYGAALVPDLDIYRYNGEEEFYLRFDAQAVEKLAIDFMKNYRQKEITVDHASDVEEVTIVESWLKADLYKDKSVALGLNPNLPLNTWFIGMKVNNVDVWEKVKDGSYKGFSVESFVSLEEFERQVPKEEVQMEEEPVVEPQPVEPTPAEPVAEPTPAEPAPVVEEPAPAPEPQPVVEEPVVEPAPEPQPAVEEPEPVAETEPNPLEDLIKSLQSEIESLKSANNDLITKVNDLSKQPSAKPISTVGANGGNGGDTFRSWREQMARYM